MIAFGDIAGTTGMGFSRDQFGLKEESDFQSFVVSKISEQSGLLRDRVGVTAYASSAYAVQVRRAEKCLTAAELLRIRINHMEAVAVVNGEIPELTHLRSQIDAYAQEADALIGRITSGAVADAAGFATGGSVSSSAHRMEIPI